MTFGAAKAIGEFVQVFATVLWIVLGFQSLFSGDKWKTPYCWGLAITCWFACKAWWTLAARIDAWCERKLDAWRHAR